jgi:hypothetical protein
LLPWSQIQCSTVEEIVSVDIGELSRVNGEGAVLGETVSWISPVHLEFPILRVCDKVLILNFKMINGKMKRTDSSTSQGDFVTPLARVQEVKVVFENESSLADGALYGARPGHRGLAFLFLQNIS